MIAAEPWTLPCYASFPADPRHAYHQPAKEITTYYGAGLDHVLEHSLAEINLERNQIMPFQILLTAISQHASSREAANA